MAYTLDDINGILKSHIKAMPKKERDALIREYGYISNSTGGVSLGRTSATGAPSMYTEKQAKKIADEVRDAIITAYNGVLKNGPDQYGGFSSGITVDVKTQKDGTIKAFISFSGASLYRPSFMRRRGKRSKKMSRTGTGVNDIFAIVSNGYKAKKRVYGVWESRSVFIPSLPERKGTPFVQNTIEVVKQKYDGIEITIPDEWK